MSANRIIVQPLSEKPSELLAFLEGITQPFWRDETVWRATVVEKSLLGPYLVEGMGMTTEYSATQWVIDEPNERYRPNTVNAPWDLILSQSQHH